MRFQASLETESLSRMGCGRYAGRLNPAPGAISRKEDSPRETLNHSSTGFPVSVKFLQRNFKIIIRDSLFLSAMAPHKPSKH